MAEMVGPGLTKCPRDRSPPACHHAGAFLQQAGARGVDLPEPECLHQQVAVAKQLIEIDEDALPA